MKKKVSEIIVDFLSKKGISQAFGVTGGGAMHLNDAFSKNKNSEVITLSTMEKSSVSKIKAKLLSYVS